jgi:hypothetical protein
MECFIVNMATVNILNSKIKRMICHRKPHGTNTENPKTIALDSVRKAASTFLLKEKAKFHRSLSPNTGRNVL